MTRDEVESVTAALVGAGRAVTTGDVALAALAVDETRIRAEASDTVTWGLWDKETAINGAPAEVVLANRGDLDAAEVVYLIYVDGAAVVTQPTVPGTDEPLTEETAATAARADRNQIVHDRTMRRLVEAVALALDEDRGRAG